MNKNFHIFKIFIIVQLVIISSTIGILADGTNGYIQMHPPLIEHLSSDLEDSSADADIPSWYQDDTWVYDTAINYDSENLTFNGKVTNLKIQVKSIETIRHNNKDIHVYKNKITGNVTGKLIPREPISWPFPITGKITGYTYTRLSDLSQVKMDVTLRGTTQVGGGLTIWIFDISEGETIGFEFKIKSDFHPTLENYDFPLELNETWSTLLQTNMTLSISFAGGLYKDEFTTSFTQRQNLSCIEQTIIQTNQGDYPSFKLSSPDIKNNSLWYTPALKNSVRLHVNYSEDDTIFSIETELKTARLITPDIIIEQSIQPNKQYVNEDITISGRIYDVSSDQPIANEPVIIEIPIILENWTVQTNQNGEYSLTIPAPNIIDYTPSSSYSFGSDGIIVWWQADAERYYSIRSFTSLSDNIVPSVSIKRPMNNYLYINNKEIGDFFTSLVIGEIEIRAEASDLQTGIDHVDIYVDDTLKSTIAQPPYVYQWTEKDTGTHIIKVIAVDNWGNQNQKTITVYRLF